MPGPASGVVDVVSGGQTPAQAPEHVDLPDVSASKR